MQELERTLPIPARCFAIDLTDASQRETLENELAARKPNVKLLVNASGFGKIGTVGNLPLDDETGMVEAQLQGAVRGHAYGASLYERKQPDSPVRVSSLLSAAAGICHLRGNQGICLKLQQRALREELRPRRIGVTAVCPGPVKTRVFRHCRDNRGDSSV